MKLTITNTLVKVSEAKDMELQSISNSLKYEIKNIYSIKKFLEKKFGKNNKRVYTELEQYKYKDFFLKKQYFYSGFIKRVLEDLEKNNIRYEIEDKTRKKDVVVKDITLPNINLYSYQKDAIKFILEKKRAVINAPTGSGKSMVGVAFVYNTKLKTLWLTHKLDLIQQVYKDFCNIFDKKEIGIIGNGQLNFNNITIGTVQTLNNLIKNDKDLAAEELSKFDAIIIDEAHRTSSNSFVNVALLTRNAEYRIGLTATPFMKSDEENKILEGIISKDIFTIQPKELIDRNILAKPFVYYEKIENQIYGDEWQDIYIEGIVNNELRNSKIKEISLKRVYKKDKVLIIVLHIEHGEKLYKYLEEDCNVKFVSGTDDTIKRQNAIEDIENNNIDVLIATNIFDEGVNIQNVNTVILAGGGKSAPALFQRIGRGMRAKTKEKVLIVDFFDKQHGLLLKHSIERFKMISGKEGYKIIKNIEEYDKENR